MASDVDRKWDNFLDPVVLRPNLITASIYIAGFELSKNTLVERIKSFTQQGLMRRDRGSKELGICV